MSASIVSLSAHIAGLPVEEALMAAPAFSVFFAISLRAAIARALPGSRGRA